MPNPHHSTDPDATTAETADAVDRERLRRPSRMRSIELGEFIISYVPDGSVTLKPRSWLPDSTEHEWAVHSDHLDTNGYLSAGIGALLIEYGKRALLIDTGVGPITVPDAPENLLIGRIEGGALLDNLARLGRTPDQIEAVAFTHLHNDHIGWASHLAPGDDSPAFTAAEYLIAEPEWAPRHTLPERGITADMLAAMTPKVRTIADGEEIFPGVHAMVTPGHTAGHTIYTITSRGQRLLAFGDALHSPLQVRYPHWSAGVDHDRIQSARSRRQLVDALAESGDLAFGNHFADVIFGTVGRDRNGDTSWVPRP